MSLAGVGAVVTGGASGIGRGVAEALAAEGAEVIVADLQADLGEAFAAESDRLHFVQTDVTSTEDMQRVAAAADALPGGSAMGARFVNRRHQSSHAPSSLLPACLHVVCLLRVSVPLIWAWLPYRLLSPTVFHYPPPP